MDNHSEAILTACHPVLIERVHSLVSALEGEGFTPHVSQGVRSVAQQNALYAQGRTADGNIVTNAKAAESNHVMGWACDLWFSTNGEIDWKSPGFDRMASLAPSFGLRSGAKWGDRPHVELDEFPTKPTPEMEAAYESGGIEGVWAAFLPLTS